MNDSLRRLPRRNPQPSSIRRQNPLVLYVEDEDANWRVAHKHLSPRYALCRARNSREVFALLREKSYCAILMDIQLAGSDLNGIEITRLLHKDPAIPVPSYAKDFHLDIVPPIIFVTAYSSRYSEKELLTAGGRQALPKQVELTALHCAIARALADNIRAT
jgi:CheY-like chemotaxis protein